MKLIDDFFYIFIFNYVIFSQKKGITMASILTSPGKIVVSTPANIYDFLDSRIEVNTYLPRITFKLLSRDLTPFETKVQSIVLPLLTEVNRLILSKGVTYPFDRKNVIQGLIEYVKAIDRTYSLAKLRLASAKPHGVSSNPKLILTLECGRRFRLNQYSTPLSREQLEFYKRFDTERFINRFVMPSLAESYIQSLALMKIREQPDIFLSAACCIKRRAYEFYCDIEKLEKTKCPGNIRQKIIDFMNDQVVMERLSKSPITRSFNVAVIQLVLAEFLRRGYTIKDFKDHLDECIKAVFSEAFDPSLPIVMRSNFDHSFSTEDQRHNESVEEELARGV